MTGKWEQALQTIAEGADWSLPHAHRLKASLDAVTPKLRDTAQNPGLSGQSGDSARESFQASAAAAVQLRAVLDTVAAGVDQANAARAQAKDSLSALPWGDLGPVGTALLAAATVGATIALGPISIIAGPFAADAANRWLTGQRETAARTAVLTAKNSFISAQPDFELPFLPRDSQSDNTTINPPTVPPGIGDTRISLVPMHPSIIDHTPQTGDGTWTGAPGAVGGLGSSPFGGGYVAPVLSADGPIASGVATLGGTPRGGLLSGASGGKFAGAGLGGFSSGNGFGAGIGGAAALGAGSLISKTGLRGLGGGGVGGSGLGGVGGGRVAGGGSGLAGAGGSAAGGGRVAGSGSGLAGAGASSRGSGSGMLGSQGAAEGRGASAGASESGRAGGRGAPGMMGGGGHGGGGADKKTASTGLGGLIAPKLDDDAELGPRSAAAGAGGRD